MFGLFSKPQRDSLLGCSQSPFTRSGCSCTCFCVPLSMYPFLYRQWGTWRGTRSVCSCTCFCVPLSMYPFLYRQWGTWRGTRSGCRVRSSPVVRRRSKWGSRMMNCSVSVSEPVTTPASAPPPSYHPGKCHPSYHLGKCRRAEPVTSSVPVRSRGVGGLSSVDRRCLLCSLLDSLFAKCPVSLRCADAKTVMYDGCSKVKWQVMLMRFALR